MIKKRIKTNVSKEHITNEGWQSNVQYIYLNIKGCPKNEGQGNRHFAWLLCYKEGGEKA